MRLRIHPINEQCQGPPNYHRLWACMEPMVIKSMTSCPVALKSTNSFHGFYPTQSGIRPDQNLQQVGIFRQNLHDFNLQRKEEGFWRLQQWFIIPHHVRLTDPSGTDRLQLHNSPPSPSPYPSTSIRQIHLLKNK